MSRVRAGAGASSSVVARTRSITPSALRTSTMRSAGGFRRGRSKHHGDAMRDAFAEITSGSADRVLGEVDVQLVGSWMFNDRQLP